MLFNSTKVISGTNISIIRLGVDDIISISNRAAITCDNPMALRRRFSSVTLPALGMGDLSVILRRFPSVGLADVDETIPPSVPETALMMPPMVNRAMMAPGRCTTSFPLLKLGSRIANKSLSCSSSSDFILTSFELLLLVLGGFSVLILLMGGSATAVLLLSCSFFTDMGSCLLLSILPPLVDALWRPSHKLVKSILDRFV
mmetsp:Transcript_7580/g.11244  ORF Transcript_7580/g.11244 Transcript_7580/m.11244 type:complete len:201 (+) Transcript_7580:414-1016(+)